MNSDILHAAKICGPDMRSGAPHQRLRFSSDLGMPPERWSRKKPERRSRKMPGRQARPKNCGTPRKAAGSSQRAPQAVQRAAPSAVTAAAARRRRSRLWQRIQTAWCSRTIGRPPSSVCYSWSSETPRMTRTRTRCCGGCDCGVRGVNDKEARMTKWKMKQKIIFLRRSQFG